MTKMTTQKCCSLIRKLQNSVQLTKTIPSCPSDSSPAVIKTFSKNFVTVACRCSPSSCCSLQRNTWSIYRNDRTRSLFKGVPKKKIKFREFSTKSNLPIIYLFTKDGCSLCDVAKEALKPHMHRVINYLLITLDDNFKILLVKKGGTFASENALFCKLVSRR